MEEFALEMTDRCRNRLLAARLVLGLAVVLLVVLQFTSMMFIGRKMWFYEIWGDLGEALVEMLHSRFEPLPFVAGGIFVFIHLFVFAQPFLADFYSRARVLLWIARLITCGPWIWWTCTGALSEVLQAFPRMEREPMVAVALLVLALLPVGLFLVPVRRSEETHPSAIQL